ncbi:hypothetical protein BDB00DRAFT_143288 [Zychaea mexicana]|uniref:uncharacterized protein n=1 Tax=Zychaea mexicana TaxID=64656 RepID=UPI0022FF4045|nr:uncharacterized protein BDB00DRAFT_143288 [Zychaea mexicana]KAI9496333.1 hypothetical protein BDB00DRAFT_143288 [Zychaea mexicana]
MKYEMHFPWIEAAHSHAGYIVITLLGLLLRNVSIHVPRACSCSFQSVLCMLLFFLFPLSLSLSLSRVNSEEQGTREITQIVDYQQGECCCYQPLTPRQCITQGSTS